MAGFWPACAGDKPLDPGPPGIVTGGSRTFIGPGGPLRFGFSMGRPPLEDLEQTFRALGNINRLKLLLELQEPKGYREIELPPSRADDRGSPDRSISRPAIRRHLDELMEIGVVQQEKDGRSDVFLLDHARLFAVVENLRELATIRPKVAAEGDTMDIDVEAPAIESRGPHLVLARGVEEGRVYPLDGEPGQRSWELGRDAHLDIPLDYDAYVSSRHARIEHRDGEFLLVDLPSNKNGTYLNWAKLAQGAVAPLAPGDIIGAGRSLLVFRRGRA